jgi:hypothetical protein
MQFTASLASEGHGLGYLGPTIRGAIGHALKDAVTRSTEDAEAYALLFDGQAPPGRSIMRRYPSVPQPLVLQVSPPESWWGPPDILQFGIRLFGPAQQHASRVCDTVEEVGRRGIGRTRTSFTVTHVSRHQPARTRDVVPSRIRWSFDTPLSMRSQGHEVIEPSGLDLLLAGRRRWTIMNEFYGASLDTLNMGDRVDAADFRVESASLRRWSIQRYSGRQERRVPLRGTIGSMVISGPWAETGDWIHDIVTLHLGKHCSFGFGRVRWEAA